MTKLPKQISPSIFFLTLCLAIICLNQTHANPNERKELVEAALHIAPSVVRVDRIAAETAGGDMLEGAPATGLVIDESGLVLTSRLSVAGNPSGILVTTNQGKRFSAKLIAEDISREIALLQLQTPEGLVPAKIAASDREPLPLGLGVIAVGCAVESKTPTVSLGIISGSKRAWGRAIQTDARVSLSQFGGPLLDRQGNVLGILIPATGTEMAGDAGLDWYDSGVALATPTQAIVSRLEKLRAGEMIHPGLIGISWGDLFVPGTKIASVHPGSPAAKSGIKPGDEILAVQGIPVTRMDQVRVAMGAFDAGDTISLRLRNENSDTKEKRERTIELKLVDALPPYEPGILGLWCQTKDDKLTVTNLLPGGPAVKAGIVVGDVIIAAADEPISSPLELSNHVNMVGKGDSLKLSLVGRDEISLVPEPIDGELPNALPKLTPNEEEWSWQEFALPELPNKAKLWGPTVASDRNYGLLVIAPLPSKTKLEEVASKWQAEAQRNAVILLVLSAREQDHWNPDEAETLSRLTRQAARRHPIDPLRIGVTGEGPGAALALVAGLGEPETFRGIACPSETKLPRIRPKQNDPAHSVQLLWLGGKELPKWMQALNKFGFAVRYSDDVKIDSLEGGKALLSWNQLLGLL